MYRIDKIFHNIKERKLAKRLCERERERESLAGILIASIKAMLYDRMCKKIFRVDGMLLPSLYPSIDQIVSFILREKLRKIPLKLDVCLNSR